MHVSFLAWTLILSFKLFKVNILSFGNAKVDMHEKELFDGNVCDGYDKENCLKLWREWKGLGLNGHF